MKRFASRSTASARCTGSVMSLARCVLWFIPAWMLVLGVSPATAQQPSDLPAAAINDIDRNQDPQLFERMFGNALATRPPADSGPTVIYYGIEVEEVRAVEAAARRYYVRGFLWTYWRDPRANLDERLLQGIEPSRRESASLKWDAREIRDRQLVWDPGFDFTNADRELEITSGTVEIFPVKQGHNDQPEVEYWCRFSGWFSDQSNQLDFHDFPFDRQRLLIDVSTSYGAEQVVFRRCWELTDDDILRLASRLAHPEWDFESVDIGVAEGSYVSEGNRRFSIGRTAVEVRRKPGYYAMNLGLPIAIILALFNCLVAFSLVVNAEVPKIPYMTIFGKSLLACYSVITLGAAFTVLHHVFSARSAAVGRNAAGRHAMAVESLISRWGAIGMNAASIAIVAYFLSGLLR